AEWRSTEEDLVCLGQDLLRTSDYLQARGDINMEQIGYYGRSWGARIGPRLSTIEPRLKALVLEGGGLDDMPLRQEQVFLDGRHSLPQVKVPVLMLNGEPDPIFPVKESQKPMFELLGSPIKEHYVHPGSGHMLPRNVKLQKMLQWFDRYLGTPTG